MRNLTPEQKQQVLAIIEALNQESYTILYIDDTLYQVTRFDPAEKGIIFHYIQGYNIDPIIKNMLSMANIKAAIAFYNQSIELLKPVKRQYSQSFDYILYLFS